MQGNFKSARLIQVDGPSWFQSFLTVYIPFPLVPNIFDLIKRRQLSPPAQCLFYGKSLFFRFVDRPIVIGQALKNLTQ